MAFTTIEFYRHKRGMTQVKLARAMDVSSSYISNIEAGLALPSTAVAMKMAEALDCEINDLFETEMKLVPMRNRYVE